MQGNGRVAALVLAAGEGSRLGGAVPKAFVTLGGRCIVERSLETLERVALVDRVVPVVPEARAELWERVAPGGPKRADPVPGGARRQDSVQAGVDALGDDVEWVAVHDAARCLVSPEEVEAVIRAAGPSGAAILARPSPDTVKLVRNDVVESTPERSACWVAQTPQVFRLELLREALAKARADAFEATDDAQLVERLGVPVRIVLGSVHNLKITHPIDLVIAEALVERAEALARREP